MKAVLPEPVHESYRRHRKQRTAQIILPMVLVALVFLGDGGIDQCSHLPR